MCRTPPCEIIRGSLGPQGLILDRPQRGMAARSFPVVFWNACLSGLLTQLGKRQPVFDDTADRASYL